MAKKFYTICGACRVGGCIEPHFDMSVYASRNEAAQEVAAVVNETLDEEESSLPRVDPKECEFGYVLSCYNDDDDRLHLKIVEHEACPATDPRKALYIISGNVGGAESEPITATDAAKANISILSMAVGELGRIGMVDNNGTLKCEVSVYYGKESKCTKISHIACISDPKFRAVTSVTARKLSANSYFAEWRVTKVKI